MELLGCLERVRLGRFPQRAGGGVAGGVAGGSVAVAPEHHVSCTFSLLSFLS